MRRPLVLPIVAAALAVPAVPAGATGSCGASPTTLGVAVDAVSPVDMVDWWHYRGVPAQYLVTLTPLVIAEANLTVADASCATECTSDQLQNVPDLCLVSAPTGVLNIAVRNYAGPFDAPYVLTVTPVLPTFEQGR